MVEREFLFVNLHNYAVARVKMHNHAYLDGEKFNLEKTLIQSNNIPSLHSSPVNMSCLLLLSSGSQTVVQFYCMGLYQVSWSFCSCLTEGSVPRCGESWRFSGPANYRAIAA